MFKKLNGWMGLAALGLTSNLAWGATLTDVGFAALPGDRTQVTLTFDEAPPQPAGYTIDKPARIALDLNGVTNGLSSKYHNLGMGNAQSMTVVESQGRTRVVFNLVQMVPYSTSIAGNQMIVVVGDEAGSQVANAAPAVSGVVQTASSASAGVPSVAGVDFRRGPKGEGQVLINFSSSTVNVELVEQAGRILMRVPEAALPNELRRRLDVTDFATPVKRVDTYTEGDVVVIDVRPEGNYDYLAYQADNSFTLSVEPLTQDEVDKRRKEKFPYSGEKLSLNFQDIEVRSVLQLIADFTGLNLVASDTVGGRITLRLQNVPWDQALDLILKTKALDKRQIGNVLLVAPAAEIAEREKQELETSKQVAELAPVRLDIVQVNYAKAADIVGLLKQDKDLISERGFISSDARTNTISVRETADKLEQIRSLVTTWDIPVRQVLIEARIVRARTNLSQDLGVEWGGAAYRRDGDKLLTVGGNIATLGQVTDV
ncbi:MAG: AMIN domain-containing protein, partial [Gammaproteobacteria bacterium]|nr:AMIN domain-containing protein [Gammaproteobacteria bacterium]